MSDGPKEKRLLPRKLQRVLDRIEDPDTRELVEDLALDLEDEDESDQEGSAPQGVLMLIDKAAPKAQALLEVWTAELKSERESLPEGERFLVLLPKKDRADALATRDDSLRLGEETAFQHTQAMARHRWRAIGGLLAFGLGGGGLAAAAAELLPLSTPLMFICCVLLGLGGFAFVPSFYREGYFGDVLSLFRRRNDGDGSEDDPDQETQDS